MPDEKKQMTVILRAKNRTRRAFRSMKKTGKQSIETLKRGFQILKGAVLAFATAILASGVVALKKMIGMTKRLLQGAVDTASQFEVFRMQFNVLTGSVEDGGKAFEELWDTARKLPYTIDEITAGAKQLQAWGVMGMSNIQESMMGVADASALAGTNIERMSVVIGRAWQQGRFLTRGPGALLRGIMKTKMGIEDITELSLPEFQRALKDLLTNPEYGVSGMASNLATTFTGIKSMISDAVTNIKLEIAGAGFFDEVTGFAEDIRVWLNSKPVLKRMRELGKIGTEVVGDLRRKLLEMTSRGQINELMDDWIRMARNFSNILKGLIANLPAIARMMMNMVNSLVMGLNKVFDAVDDLIVGAGKLTGKTFKLEMALSKINKQMLEGGRRVTGLKEGMEDLETIFGQKRTFWEYWSAYKNAISDAGDSLSEFVSERKALDELREKIQNMPRGGGRNDLIRDFQEMALDLQRKLVAEVENENDALNKKYNIKQNELLLLQQGYNIQIEIGDTLEDIKAKMAKFKWETGQTVNEWEDMKSVAGKVWEKFTGREGEEAGKAMDVVADKLDKAKNNVIDFLNVWDDEGAWPFDPHEVKTLTERWDDFLETLKDKTGELGDVATQVAEGMASTFEDMFFDIMIGEFKDLSDYLENFGRLMLQIIARQLAMRTAMGMMGPFASKEGGIVPDRFAGGGSVRGRDSVPALLTPNEMVLNERQQTNLMRLLNNNGSFINPAEQGGAVINNTWNVKALDGADLYRTLDRNKEAFSTMMQKARVNNMTGARGYKR